MTTMMSRTKIKHNLSEAWLKASIIGSLWASFEIVTGSLFHNLRIPFAGSLLSFFSVILMVSFVNVWDQKGLFIRSALICALMKSISPSGVILGPMTGILMEGALLELFTLILGRNYIGFLVGGGFAVLSALFHKIINLIIIFGFDLVAIAEDLYEFFTVKTGISNLKPGTLIMLVFGLYFFAGVVAAGIACRVSNKVKKNLSGAADEKSFIIREGSGFNERMAKQKHSIWRLWLNLVLLVFGLIVLNKDSKGLIFIPAALIMAYNIAYYPGTKRIFKRKGFWLQILILILITAFLWRDQSENLFSGEGFLAGVKISFRAMWLIVSFSAISYELRNPLIKSLLYRKGLNQLFISLQLAFSILPRILEENRETTKLVFPGKKILHQMIHVSKIIYREVQMDQRQNTPVIVLTGERGEGKTTFLKSLLLKLQDHDYKPSGYLAEGIFEQNEKKGFMLVDILSGHKEHLASLQNVEGWKQTGRYYMNASLMYKGLDKLQNTPNKILVIDEVGPLELEGQGWADILENPEKYQPELMIWVVRKRLLNSVMARWNSYSFSSYEIKKVDISEIIYEISSSVSP